MTELEELDFQVAVDHVMSLAKKHALVCTTAWTAEDKSGVVVDVTCCCVRHAGQLLFAVVDTLRDHFGAELLAGAVAHASMHHDPEKDETIQFPEHLG